MRELKVAAWAARSAVTSVTRRSPLQPSRQSTRTPPSTKAGLGGCGTRSRTRPLTAAPLAKGGPRNRVDWTDDVGRAGNESEAEAGDEKEDRERPHSPTQC